MGKNERFEVLEKEKIDKNVYYYLKNFFDQLNIEVLGRYEGKLFDLMKKGKLEGRCWETTESAALFMPNDVVVYRGNLYFDDYETYYHSYLQFNYENKKYVFDPSLCMINTLDLYFNIFNVDVKGKVTAKEIKEYFINYVTNLPKKEDYFSLETISSSDEFMRRFFDNNYLEKKEKEIVIHDKEDPSSPMYRNGSGYTDINIDNDKIKSLTVHFY